MAIPINFFYLQINLFAFSLHIFRSSLSSWISGRHFSIKPNLGSCLFLAWVIRQLWCLLPPTPSVNASKLKKLLYAFLIVGLAEQILYRIWYFGVAKFNYGCHIRRRKFAEMLDYTEMMLNPSFIAMNDFNACYEGSSLAMTIVAAFTCNFVCWFLNLCLKYVIKSKKISAVKNQGVEGKEKETGEGISEVEPVLEARNHNKNFQDCNEDDGVVPEKVPTEETLELDQSNECQRSFAELIAHGKENLRPIRIFRNKEMVEELAKEEIIEESICSEC